MSSWSSRKSNSHSWAVPYADVMMLLFCAMLAIAGKAIAIKAQELNAKPQATSSSTTSGQGNAPASLQLNADTLFPSGSAELSEGPALDMLYKIANKVKSEKIYVKIEGHTDNVPLSSRSPYASNWELSAARAINVVQFLEAQGVPKEYLSAVGYGDSRPLNQNKSSEDNAKNRRVILTLSEHPL